MSPLTNNLIIRILAMISHISSYVYASDLLPDSVLGISDYTYATEKLPSNSKGVYMIKNSKSNDVKYIGSSIDINNRLSCHLRSGILNKTDTIRAFIFNSKARQSELCKLEQQLLYKHTPNLNKHPGTPGRPNLEEQLDKLQVFYSYNKGYFTPEGCRVIQNILSKKSVPKDCKLSRSILKVMRIYR